MKILNFWDFPVFVFEQAPLPIRTEVFLMKLLAWFWLILAVLRFFVDHLCVSMSELAFRPITTLPILNPVFAHFSLILCLIYFLFLFSTNVKGIFLTQGKNKLIAEIGGLGRIICIILRERKTHLRFLNAIILLYWSLDPPEMLLLFLYLITQVRERNSIVRVWYKLILIENWFLIHFCLFV